jgi:hypothetical protein
MLTRPKHREGTATKNPASATRPLSCGCRPQQHSASWWPRLFADDAVDVAWDDAPKDYSDLPAPIAAAAAAEAAREDEFKQQQEERQEARRKIQVREGSQWVRLSWQGPLCVVITDVC